MANATLSLPTSVLSWLAWCSLSAPSLWPPFLIAHWLLLLEVPRTGLIASLPSGTHFYNLVFLFLLFSFLFLAPQMGCFLWFIPHYDQLPEDSTTPAVFFHINSSTYITGWPRSSWRHPTCWNLLDALPDHRWPTLQISSSLNLYFLPHLAC